MRKLSNDDCYGNQNIKKHLVLISYMFISNITTLHASHFLIHLLTVTAWLACENIRFSSLFAAIDVLREGTSATQWQKFHTDDTVQCLHNKSSSHGVPNTNLSSFMCLLVDFGKVLCLSANELQQNSNASSRADYIPQILCSSRKYPDPHHGGNFT